MRAIAAAVIVALVAALAAVQFASDAFAANAAARGTLPTRVSKRFANGVYEWLDRTAPAAYVEATLAQAALAQGDTARAERHAVRLPASPTRDELLARIALARGEPVLALEYFLAAPDADAVQQVIAQRAVRDPAAGYALALLLQRRLALLRTHPDALADADWRTGLLANQTAFAQVPGSPAQRAWLHRALDAFEDAVRLSPLSEQYVIAAANQADLLDDRRRAEQLFRSAEAIDPTSADAVAGLGVIAFQDGRRGVAASFLERARRLDSRSRMVRALERDLR